MLEFGKKIRNLREEHHITQKELSKVLNVRNTTISAWEKDIAEPPFETLKKFCVLFDVSADYLLGLEDETGQKTYINSFNNFNISGNSGTIKF